MNFGFSSGPLIVTVILVRTQFDDPLYIRILISNLGGLPLVRAGRNLQDSTMKSISLTSLFGIETAFLAVKTYRIISYSSGFSGNFVLHAAITDCATMSLVTPFMFSKMQSS